jgi:hypothetical protein
MRQLGERTSKRPVAANVATPQHRTPVPPGAVAAAGLVVGQQVADRGTVGPHSEVRFRRIGVGDVDEGSSKRNTSTPNPTQNRRTARPPLNPQQRN